jgi:hypothetical protein
MTDYGRDLSCTTDIEPMFREVTGIELMQQAIIRRLITPRGGLLGAPNYGYDVRNLINDSLSSTQGASLIRAAVQSELDKDERILQSQAKVLFVPSTHKLTIEIQAVSTVGPFALTIGVSDVTIEVLNASGME